MSNLTPLPESILDGLSRYIHCILVVQFDVDVGPDLKIIRPAIQFSENDFRLICFSSLPERTSDVFSTQPNQFHSFTFISEGVQLHGYCMFNQIRDPARNRGYLQESTVIISHLNNPDLFAKLLLQIVGQDSYVQSDLDHKIPVIDSALSSISQWPDPESAKLDLAFLGHVLRNEQLNCPYSTATSWGPFLTRIADVADLYMAFESLMLNRPMVVYASSPHLCSTFIYSLLSFITPPLCYQNPIREYVTVHSYSENPASAELLGIANPFLLQHFKKLPFVMVLGDASSLSDDKLLAKVRASNKALLKDRLLNPDTKVLANILAISDPLQQDHAIKFHFTNLATRLLSPLTMYLDASRDDKFQHSKFTKDVQNPDWNQINNKLFTNMSQSLIQKLSLRNVGDTILTTVGGTLGSIVGVGSSSSASSPTSLSPLASPPLISPPAERPCKQVFYKEFLDTPIFRQWVTSLE